MKHRGNESAKLDCKIIANVCLRRRGRYDLSESLHLSIVKINLYKEAQQ
ncbi:MAG: hypothetical protein ACE5GH_01485 [Fidelibacterota bacterium]